MSIKEVSLEQFSLIKYIKRDPQRKKLLIIIEDKETKKQYFANSCYDEDSENELRHELHFLEKYCHSTFTNLIGYSEIDFFRRKCFTLIYEYAVNDSLQSLLDKGTLDNTQRQIILVGICRGMMLLHANRTIIRSLKPTNILIDENFHPRISNFTYAEQIEDGKEIFYDIGSIYYMAPEIYCGGEVDISSDVFSFAILMFQVVTNSVKPYIYMEERSIFDLGVRPVFNVPVKIPIKSLIERCWSGDPDERPTFEELFHKLAFESEFFLDDVNTDKLLSYVNSIIK